MLYVCTASLCPSKVHSVGQAATRDLDLALKDPRPWRILPIPAINDRPAILELALRLAPQALLRQSALQAVIWRLRIGRGAIGYGPAVILGQPPVLVGDEAGKEGGRGGGGGRGEGGGGRVGSEHITKALRSLRVTHESETTLIPVVGSSTLPGY